MLQCAAVLAHPVARHKVLMSRRRGDLVQLAVAAPYCNRTPLLSCVAEQSDNGLVSSLARLLVIGKNQIADFDILTS